jgi:hypothetical protein
MADWLNRRARIYWYDQYANNEQATAFAHYDPDRIVAELVGTGVDIVAVYAANQFGIAYYPSAIWPQHPGLHGRDYVGDLVSRLRRHGKKVLLYINWLDSKHPEWNAVPLGSDPERARAAQPLASWADPTRPEGRVQDLPGGHWQLPCANSPKRGQVVALAREIVQRYRPDAFHLDMFFNTTPCVCPFCRPHLERICGTREITLQTLAEHWPAYIDWVAECSASLIAEVSAVLRENGVVAAHNAFAPLYQPAIGGVGEGWLPALDVWTSECFDAFMAPCSDLNAASINVRWQHAIGKPAWILRTSTSSHYSHWPIAPAKWAVYAAACKANGVKAFGPCGIGARPDTTSAAGLLANVRGAFDLIMEDADLDEGAVPDSRIALVFSWATRKYFDGARSLTEARWAQEFMGWARVLIEEHLPFDIVVAENLTAADRLAGYDLVVLPNAAHLGDACCAALRDYVRQGGRLLATAETALGDDRGRRRTDFALGDVLGIASLGAREGHFAMERPGDPEPASGVLQEIAARGRVLSRSLAVDPAGSVCAMKDPLPLGEPGTPVLVTAGHGRGHSLYVAFDVGRFYEMHGDAHIGRFMAEQVDRLLPARQVLVHAPRTVEVTVWRQESRRRLVVHLANRTVPWSLPTDAREITEIIPVHDVEISLPCPFADPFVSARHAEVTFRVVDDRLLVRLARLEAYAAVLIEAT